MALRMLYNKSASYDQVLSTTVAYILRPKWAVAMEIVGDGDFEWLFTEQPALISLYDDSAATYTDITGDLTDGSTAGTGTGTGTKLNSLEAADILYVGFRAPVSGVFLDVTNANGTASVIDAEYYGVPATPAWTDITETDGTASGGASFAVDGAVTWTALTNWVQVQCPVGASTTGPILPNVVRFKQSVGFDSATSVVRLLGLQNEQVYAEAEGGSSGDAFVPRVRFDKTRVGGVQLKAAAGSPNCTVTWYGRN